MSALPAGPFGLIECDSPHRFVSRDGKKAVPTLGPDPYKTMSVDELKALPVGEVAAPDCLLIAWTTSDQLVNTIAVSEAWGFTYRSLGLVWVKERSPDQAEMFDHDPISDLGMGYWFRQQCEISLVFGKGSPTRLDAGVRQVIYSPRREHSRKPDALYDRLERIAAGPRLQLFGVEEREGWTVWNPKRHR